MNFYKYQGKEKDFQKSIAKFLDSLNILWFHVPNGGYRNLLEAKELKKQGVKSGIPDVLILEKRNDYLGLAIELKVGRNKLTENQNIWFKKLNNYGFHTLCTHSLDECIYEIKKYLSK